MNGSNGLKICLNLCECFFTWTLYSRSCRSLEKIFEQLWKESGYLYVHCNCGVFPLLMVPNICDPSRVWNRWYWNLKCDNTDFNFFVADFLYKYSGRYRASNIVAWFKNLRRHGRIFFHWHSFNYNALSWLVGLGAPDSYQWIPWSAWAGNKHRHYEHYFDSLHGYDGTWISSLYFDWPPNWRWKHRESQDHL